MRAGTYRGLGKTVGPVSKSPIRQFASVQKENKQWFDEKCSKF